MQVYISLNKFKILDLVLHFYLFWGDAPVPCLAIFCRLGDAGEFCWVPRRSLKGSRTLTCHSSDLSWKQKQLTVEYYKFNMENVTSFESSHNNFPRGSLELVWKFSLHKARPAWGREKISKRSRRAGSMGTSPGDGVQRNTCNWLTGGFWGEGMFQSVLLENLIETQGCEVGLWFAGIPGSILQVLVSKVVCARWTAMAMVAASSGPLDEPASEVKPQWKSVRPSSMSKACSIPSQVFCFSGNVFSNCVFGFFCWVSHSIQGHGKVPWSQGQVEPCSWLTSLVLVLFPLSIGFFLGSWKNHRSDQPAHPPHHSCLEEAMASLMLQQLPAKCKVLILEHNAGLCGQLVVLSDDVSRPSYKDFGIREKEVLLKKKS